MKKIGSHIMASGLFLCSLFGLWIVGIMPAISLIIGAISLLGFAAAIGYIQTPVIRKGTYWFYGTMVLFIALNTIYSLIPTQIKEELQANKKVETIKMAEHLHPSGSGTVEIIRDVCKEEYEKNLQGILERYKSSTDANRSERMIEQIQGLEAQRKKCGEAILSLGANGQGGRTRGLLSNIGVMELIVILGIVFLSIFIIGVVFKIHILWKVSFAAGMILFVVWLFYREGGFEETTAIVAEKQDSVETKHPQKQLAQKDAALQERPYTIKAIITGWEIGCWKNIRERACSAYKGKLAVTLAAQSGQGTESNLSIALMPAKDAKFGDYYFHSLRIDNGPLFSKNGATGVRQWSDKNTDKAGPILEDMFRGKVAKIHYRDMATGKIEDHTIQLDNFYKAFSILVDTYDEWVEG